MVYSTHMQRTHDTDSPSPIFLLPWGLAAVLGLVAPWLLGGQASKAYPIMTFLALLAVLGILFAVLMDYRNWNAFAFREARSGIGRPNPLRVFALGLVRTLPLWFFIGFLYLGLSNPAYLREGNRLIPQAFNAALPTVADAGFSAPGIQFLASLLALAALLANPACRARRAWLRTLLALLLINALILAWTGIYFRFLGNGQLLGRYPSRDQHFFATFYYKNHWAAFALLYCGVATGFFFRDLPRWFARSRKAGSGGLALAALFFFGLTFFIVESRSGILLFSLFGFILAGGLFACIRSRRSRWLLAVVTLAGVGGGLYLALADRGDEGFRTGSRLQQSDSVPLDRMRVENGSQASLAMFRDRPFWGWGYRSFEPLYPGYSTDYLWNTDAFFPLNMESFCSDWLRHLAEFGLVGSALLLLGLILLPRPARVGPAFNLKAEGLMLGLRLRDADRGLYEREHRLAPGLGMRTWVRICILLLGLLALWDMPFSNPAVLASVAILFLISRRLA